MMASLALKNKKNRKQRIALVFINTFCLNFIQITFVFTSEIDLLF